MRNNGGREEGKSDIGAAQSELALRVFRKPITGLNRSNISLLSGSGEQEEEERRDFELCRNERFLAERRRDP